MIFCQISTGNPPSSIPLFRTSISSLLRCRSPLHQGFPPVPGRSPAHSNLPLLRELQLTTIRQSFHSIPHPRFLFLGQSINRRTLQKNLKLTKSGWKERSVPRFCHSSLLWSILTMSFPSPIVLRARRIHLSSCTQTNKIESSRLHLVVPTYSATYNVYKWQTANIRKTS